MLPLMVSQALCLPWETAINAALRYDPATLMALESQSGKLVCLDITGIRCVYIRLVSEGVQLSLTNHADVDVTLRGRFSDFVPVALATDKAAALMSSAVVVEGDTALATDLSHWVNRLDIDWEAMITPITSGLVAHQIGQGVRGLMSWGQQTAQTMAMAAQDYVEDEVAWVTPAPLLALFSQDVDEVRLRVDRLTARIEQLEQKALSKQADKAEEKQTL